VIIAISGRDLVAGVVLDLALGDPRWLPHPVRGIGWLASGAESMWRATGLPLRVAGALFCLSVVALSTTIVWLTTPWLNIYWIYALLACRDLDVQATSVVRALRQNDLGEARERLSWIVGRDTQDLDEQGVMRATVETVAENLSDGVIAPLFYLAVAGPAGMAAYKAINTLDSMVGYRNERYREFGWASARVDDVANYLPSRITAVLVWMVALLPGYDAARSIRVTFRDGASQPSPNSGYPEAAFAGATGVQLGGMNFYGGKPSPKALLADLILPLTKDVYPRVRALLYASEALFVCIILGCIAWR
jgi:adenosylcobinamide-phosphate synthase